MPDSVLVRDGVVRGLVRNFSALRVNVGFGVAGTGWRVMLAGVLGLGSWWGR